MMTSSSDDCCLSIFFSGFLITLNDIGRLDGSPTDVAILLLEDKLGVLYDGSTLAEGDGIADLITCCCSCLYFFETSLGSVGFGCGIYMI